MFDDFITVDMLKTFPVAVSITVILTQFFKEAIDGLFKKLKIDVHTKYVVFFFALIVVFIPIKESITFGVVAAGVLNAILLSLTAMKSYDTLVDKAITKIEEKKDTENNGEENDQV